MVLVVLLSSLPRWKLCAAFRAFELRSFGPEERFAVRAFCDPGISSEGRAPINVPVIIGYVFHSFCTALPVERLALDNLCVLHIDTILKGSSPTAHPRELRPNER